MSIYTQSTQVQLVYSSCQGDYQKLIGVNNGNWIDWINRVHQDLLRWSRWQWLKNQTPQQFTTVAGQTQYFIGSGTAPGSTTVTQIAIALNVATITANNNYVVGDGQSVTISGLAHTQLNGTWTLTQATPTTFKFNTVGLADVAQVADSGTVSSVTNTNLNLSDLDFIIDGSVINRTRGEGLYMATAAPYDVSGVWELNAPPRLWILRPTGVVELYNPPDQAYVIEFQYQMNRRALTSPTAILQVPDYYFDVVVAGVNEFAAAYLAKDPSIGDRFVKDITYWAGKYAEGKRSMIRDKQLFPRKSFIAPSLP